jgi:hypothetical protein
MKAKNPVYAGRCICILVIFITEKGTIWTFLEKVIRLFCLLSLIKEPVENQRNETSHGDGVGSNL